MSSSNNFPEPGSEINSIHKNVSPAGLQARAAATQTQAPQGTHLSDPVQAMNSPQQASAANGGVNTVATDHDPTLNFSSPGMQARAAAAGQAPVGTVQPEYLTPDAVGNSASNTYTASPMGTAPDTMYAAPQAQSAVPPQPVENTPIDSLNTAREVFQPTSSNQPQGEYAQAQPAQQAVAPPPPQPAAPQNTYYGPNSSAASSSYSQLGQAAQQAATQTASSAPEGTRYTGPNSSSTYLGPNSANQAASSYPSHQSSAGAIARSAATQTPGSAPAGTHFTQPSTPNTFSGSQQTRSASYAPSQAPSVNSPGIAARAAARGQHPPGTGPDAGIVARASAAFAGQAPRVDSGSQYSSPGMQARAAAAGQAPAGTAHHFSSQSRASLETSYEPPSSSRFNHSAQAAVSPGLQARAAAHGQHPAGTGPGSVKGLRSYSTASRVGPAVVRSLRLLKK